VGTGIELDLGIGAALGKLTSAVDRLDQTQFAIHKWLTSNPNVHPTPRLWKASRITGASASTYSVLQFQQPFDYGGPNSGYRWWLGAFSIIGTDPYTVIAGSAASLHLGGVPAQDGATAPTIDVLAASASQSVATVPWYGFIPPGSVGVLPNDALYFVVKGAGNNQLLTAEVQVFEFNERQRLFG
jgi:hypothetical protein